MSQAINCKHCDSPTAVGSLFCCIGCETAYNIVHSADISPDNKHLFSAYATQDDDGNYTLLLSVKGVHCASCIQLIENALFAEKDVISARVNMSTERLNISWSGTKERGDALANIVIKLGYQLKPFDESDSQNESSAQEKHLLRCIAVSGFSAGNLMMVSVGLWSTTTETMGISTKDFFHWISALIALPTIFYAGRPFFHSAWSVLKEKHTNMDVPISIAVILASAMSLLETIDHGEHIYFDSAVMLLFFLLIGRYLDARAKGKARQSAQDLLSLLHGTATVIEDGKISSIPIRDIRENMEILVATGESIPADSIISKGTSELDISLITGETLPQNVTVGDSIFAGTINLSAPLHLTVAKASNDSLLSDIVKLMEKAEQGQAHYVRMADKAAKLYTPVVHSMGLLTFLGWWLMMGQDWQPSLLNAITVLIITCPCALGLAVPVVQVLASSKLMKQGVLLKSGDALEKLADIDVAVFDKTGTLTIGKPELLNKDNHNSTELQIAASLAAHSKHPLSQAICRAYSGDLIKVKSIEEIPGKGLRAIIDNKIIQLGSRKWCGDELTLTPPNTALELWLSIEGKSPICYSFSDKLRDDATNTIKTLQQADIKTILLSGDRIEAVESMAEQVNIDEYHAELSPIDKCTYLEKLKANNHHILMVGDGLNDAPSLATADISISPSTAMDITQNTADIIFQGNKLHPIINAWKTAKNSTILVKQNFILAVIYNIIAIPIAVMGYVTPLIAAIAMSASSLLVIGNSFRLSNNSNGIDK